MPLVGYINDITVTLHMGGYCIKTVFETMSNVWV